MSVLRLFGILLSFLCFLVVYYRLRSHASQRSDVWVFFLFGSLMMLVSLFPGFLNIPSDILALRKYERGRLLTLLILSNIFLWFLFLYQRSKTEKNFFKINTLLRRQTVQEFLDHYGREWLTGKVLLLIPAFNEEENLKKVLPNIQKLNDPTILPLVIDDGSTDGTEAVCRELKVMVARILVNRGGGAALGIGYDIAKEVRARAVVTMDADGQHDPAEIERLLRPVLDDEADLVIGSRILGSTERYSAIRQVGVRVFGAFVSFLVGKTLTDPACGFRAFNVSVLHNCRLIQEQYHTAELIIEATKRKLRIMERPVTISSRLTGSTKKGKTLTYAFSFLITIIKTWVR